MTCFLDRHTIGNYIPSQNGVFETHLKQEYNNDSANELRGKFAGIIVWSPIQAIGHLALRLFHLLSGSFLTTGKTKAYKDYHYRLHEMPSMRGKEISEIKVVSYQLRQLAIDVGMIALFTIAAIPGRILIAFAGLFMPLDARVAYGALEKFFVSQPKDLYRSESSKLEFFTFSAPCMQQVNDDSGLYKRRCEVLCAPEHIKYQPSSILAKAHLLKVRVEYCRKYFLSKDEGEFLTSLSSRLKSLRQETPLSMKDGLDLIEGKDAKTKDEEKLLLLSRTATTALTKLDEALKAWEKGENYSFKEFFDSVQETLPKVKSV